MDGTNTDPDGLPAIRTVRVRLPLPVDADYDYLVPSDPTDPTASASVPARAVPDPGAFVEVPLGTGVRIGIVWGPGSDGVERAKLRPILRVLPAPPVPEAVRRFVDWVARYTVSPPGMVARMVAPVPGALEAPAPQPGVRRVGSVPDGVRLTPMRERVLRHLADGVPRTLADLKAEIGASAAVVRGLVAAGAVVSSDLPVPPRRFPVDPHGIGPALTADQQDAADALRGAVRRPDYSVHLLDGVTGSGKTEVYFEAIAEAVAAGRQVLVLLPEIALTGQWLGRFGDRFGGAPAAWHSDLTGARRRDTWRAVAAGTAPVVVGARSALFLPFPDLGLIVVDEEHEAAFKQEDGVIYNARDMAVARAHLDAIPIVLASATPSIETVVNVGQDRYRRLALPDRFGGARLPEMAVIDLRATPPETGHFLSRPLLEAVAETLARGEQAMLFLNRRGYAPLAICRACGHRLQCPNCTAWLTVHRLVGRLICHHCDHRDRTPHRCPECGAEDSFAPVGPGVERIAEEADRALPGANWTIVSSDTLHGPKAIATMVEQVQRREIDLLIGTQVLAKGHHFPDLTLVGVVDADLGLGGGDFRAFERTYQLLHQVAGRAGRGQRPGTVLLQSYQPETPVLQALIRGDRDGFLAEQIDDRQRGGWPPFSRLAAIILSGPNREHVLQAAEILARAAPLVDGVQILGPAEPPLAVLRGRHRRRFLIRCGRRFPLQDLIRSWIGLPKLPGSVRVTVDIDPMSFV